MSAKLLSPKFHQAHASGFFFGFGGFFFEAYGENRSLQETAIMSTPEILFLDTKTLRVFKKQLGRAGAAVCDQLCHHQTFLSITIFDNLIYKVVVKVNDVQRMV